jgi:spoIIIJ-associated protein
MKKKNDELKKILEEIVVDFLTQLGLDADIEVSDPLESDKEAGFGYVNVVLNGDNLGELIGYRGTMLESIQTVISLILTKTLAKSGETLKYRVIIDINDYRNQREQYLISYAERAVAEVLSSGQEMELSPMRPSERRIIHIALKEHDEVETSSAGDGENRRVVIKPKSK